MSTRPKRHRARPFLLLEFLVALGLLTLLLVPLLKPHMAMRQAEAVRYRELDQERLAAVAYVDLQALLHMQKQRTWKELSEGTLPNNAHYTLSKIDGFYKKSTHTRYTVLAADVTFDKQISPPFHFTFLVKESTQ